MRTGTPIVYTSADSVFQIAAHEEVIPHPRALPICEIARDILRGPHEVGRVIARPFIGAPGAFTRTRTGTTTPCRRPGMLLDQLGCAGVPVVSVGKISDVFLGRGITQSDKTKTNADGMAKTLDGHGRRWTRSDLRQPRRLRHALRTPQRPRGLLAALEEVDALAARMLEPPARRRPGHPHGRPRLRPDHASTDHSREYVPLLAWSRRMRGGVDLGLRATLSDIGQTVAENFRDSIANGASFLYELN